VFSFYTVDQATTAKWVLADAVDLLHLDRWPRPVKRKDSDEKMKKEIDIFSM